MAAEIHLHDKVAIVTGASRGIGAAIARSFARAGAKVVLASRDQGALDEVAASIRAEGGEAHGQACHTGDPEQVAALVRAAVERYGQVDVLVNNAATNPHFGPLLSVDELSMWDKTFDVNVKGYFVMAREVARHLIERQASGSIVNVASVLGTMGAPFMGIYGMTKAAVISMTQTLSLELGRQGVRVNAIAPGLIETKFAAALLSDAATTKSIVDRTGLGRHGQPEDITGPALFLASDAAAYVTGQTLTVDGGWRVS